MAVVKMAMVVVMMAMVKVLAVVLALVLSVLAAASIVEIWSPSQARRIMSLVQLGSTGGARPGLAQQPSRHARSQPAVNDAAAWSSAWDALGPREPTALYNFWRMVEWQAGLGCGSSGPCRYLGPLHADTIVLMAIVSAAAAVRFWVRTRRRLAALGLFLVVLGPLLVLHPKVVELFEPPIPTILDALPDRDGPGGRAVLHCPRKIAAQVGRQAYVPGAVERHWIRSTTCVRRSRSIDLCSLCSWPSPLAHPELGGSSSSPPQWLACEGSDLRTRQ